MPAVEVLPAITHADPLFGLIYYVLGGWVYPLLGVLAKLIFRAAHWLECGPPARRDLDIPGLFTHFIPCAHGLTI
jgi:hypothetical protein